MELLAKLEFPSWSSAWRIIHCGSSITSRPIQTPATQSSDEDYTATYSELPIEPRPFLRRELPIDAKAVYNAAQFANLNSFLRTRERGSSNMKHNTLDCSWLPRPRHSYSLLR